MCPTEVRSGTPAELDRFLPTDFGNEDEEFDDEYKYETDASGGLVKAIYIGTGIGKCDPQRTQKIRCNKSGFFFDKI